MKNQIKHKYVPCELRLTQFDVEREFATGSPNAMTLVGTSWIMNDAKDQNGASTNNYRNESYLDQTFQWAEENGL